MSNRNDEAFAEFMVRLAKKMIEREDQREAEQEALRAAMADLLQARQAITGLAATSPNNAVKSKAAALLSAFATFNPTTGSAKRAFDGRPGQFVTDDEMAVIRAYFNGEDVLTTILSQER
jgi:hypothetical protein